MTRRQKTLVFLGLFALLLVAILPVEAWQGAGFMLMFAVMMVGFLVGGPVLVVLAVGLLWRNLFGPDANRTSAEISAGRTDTAT